LLFLKYNWNSTKIHSRRVSEMWHRNSSRIRPRWLYVTSQARGMKCIRSSHNFASFPFVQLLPIKWYENYIATRLQLLLKW
jgi:hypothetical protein